MQSNPKRPSDATGTMSIMGKEGDTKYHWSACNPDQVAMARETFDAHRGKGYLAFRMNDKSNQGDQMTEFDPAAESILFIPQMQGG